MRKSIFILFIALALSSVASGCSEPAQASALVVDEAAEMPSASAEPVLPEAGMQAEPVVERPAEVAVPEPTVVEEEPSLRSADGVSVRRMMLARTIEDREPVAPTTEFRASSDRLYAFFDIRNETEDEATFLVTFDGPDGRSAGHVELSVPADVGRWRTWAYTRNATEPGEWVAQLHDVDGNLLASQAFIISE